MNTFFYDAQFKNVLSQVVRVFSNFKYMTGINHTGRKELLPVLTTVGNASRIVGSIAKKNSDNVASYAPMISCWISNVAVARNRTGSATHINQLQVSEREFDYEKQRYKEGEGSKYLVERLFPVPFDITIQVDIWSTNEDMKMQILEQILILFNPSIELQKNTNALDWTAYFHMELESINYSSRSVPVGDDVAIEVTSLTFTIRDFFLNPPAKVKKQITIQNIVTNLGFDDPSAGDGVVTWEPNDFFQNVTVYKNLQLKVQGDELELISYDDNNFTWHDLFASLNNNFEPDVYTIRLRPGYEISYAKDDVLMTLSSISASNPKKAIGNLNLNTLPDTDIPPINDVINPNALFPGNGLVEVPGYRYLIANRIIPNTEAWGPLEASAGSIIQTDDGTNWYVAYNSTVEEVGTVVRNLDDGELYVQVTEDTWTHVYFGQYRPGWWRVVNIVNNNISN